MAKKITYIGLSAFSQNGGIENVNQSWIYALKNIQEKLAFNYQVLILLDNLAPKNFINSKNFKGFKGNKIAFLANGFLAALRSDILIVSHINIAPIIFLAKIGNPKLKVILHAHGIEIWRPLNFIKKQALKLSNNILAVSQFTKNKITELHSIAPQKITVFPNALAPFFEIPKNLNKPQYLLDRYQIKENNIILFTLARLSSTEQYKGYDKIIEILPALIQKNPQVKYFIGGKGDKAEIQKITRRINHLNLQNQVHLLGFIADTELTDHYLLADIFAMPSKGEGFGISFIEASACGRKVLAGNADGSTQAVLENKTGLLCNTDNPKDILEKIEQLIQFSVTPKNIQETTIQNFSFAHYQNKIEKIISNFS